MFTKEVPMNDLERIRQLMTSSTSLFCVLVLFAIRVSVTLWSSGSLLTRFWCVGSLILCALGVFTTLQASKKLTEFTKA